MSGWLLSAGALRKSKACQAVFDRFFPYGFTGILIQATFLLCCSAFCLIYCIFRLIISARKKNRMSGIAGSRFWMTIGVLSNLGILFYFKYYDFFIENVNAVFDTSFMLKGILLSSGNQFFYLPANRFCGGFIPGWDRILLFSGLFPVRFFFPSADSGAYCKP